METDAREGQAGARDPQAAAQRSAERAARDSFGRLVAYLAWRWRDIAAAEDALAEAFRTALETWPARGVPDNPDAWLLTAARRNLLHAARHARVRDDPAVQILLAEDRVEDAPPLIPDERLRLLFICAHPAIDAAARTPLMLQTVLGLDAARIASAFLVSPATMGQRLVRAKAKIRDAGIAFEAPERAELPERLDAVLEAIYAAYGSGWEDVAGADPRRRGLAEEAIWLARVAVGLLPDEPEARGLLALMLHCEARRDARRTADGRFVPLSAQSVGLWSAPMIEEAEHELALAARAGQLGHFQLEAAIQSAHAQRVRTGETPWEGIALLYEALAALSPTTGVLVGRAAAVAEVRGARAGLTLLNALLPDTVRNYQPHWVLQAHLLKRLGRHDEAAAATARAIGLTEDPVVRAFLQTPDGR